MKQKELLQLFVELLDMRVVTGILSGSAAGAVLYAIGWVTSCFCPRSPHIEHASYAVPWLVMLMAGAALLGGLIGWLNDRVDGAFSVSPPLDTPTPPDKPGGGPSCPLCSLPARPDYLECPHCGGALDTSAALQP